MQIDSPAFVHEEKIPEKYTCVGENISPPLSFHNIPEKAKSLVLIVDDPDAPSGTFDHWVVWNIPPDTSHFPEAVKVLNQGINGYKRNAYNGPCPPPGGPHRYFFKLYALDAKLNLPAQSKKIDVENAMKGHIIAQAQMIGLFER